MTVEHLRTVIEHQHIVRGVDLDEDRFDAIASFAGDVFLTSKARLMDVVICGGNQIIIPRNYVGVIGFPDGDYLEVLPKIADTSDEESIIRTKEVFLRMLMTVFDMDPAESGMSKVGNWSSNPFEFFIRMFLEEVSVIAREGLRSGYSDTEGNEPFIRGKILFSQDLLINSSHRERTYQSYQVFDIDRPENRLIKAALEFLQGLSSEYNNRKEIRRLLQYFESCGRISDLDTELRGCIADRNMRRYSKAVRWCDIFLHNRSFTTFSGSDIAYTFLFPMEKVFESYVARLCSRHYHDRTVRIQDRSKTMFDSGIERGVRPDIVIESDETVIIIDTKWKVIESLNDISEDDLRQMKEYSADYRATAILLYPKVGYDSSITSVKGDIVVKVEFIDLFSQTFLSGI